KKKKKKKKTFYLFIFFFFVFVAEKTEIFGRNRRKTLIVPTNTRNTLYSNDTGISCSVDHQPYSDVYYELFGDSVTTTFIPLFVIPGGNFFNKKENSFLSLNYFFGFYIKKEPRKKKINKKNTATATCENNFSFVFFSTHKKRKKLFFFFFN
uniref:Uncharacterized protein n=1 Tax=Glossina austeni TaxID=7395 RepID=A0A1A9UJK9_GLOAU